MFFSEMHLSAPPEAGIRWSLECIDRMGARSQVSEKMWFVVAASVETRSTARRRGGLRMSGSLANLEHAVAHSQTERGEQSEM